MTLLLIGTVPPSAPTPETTAHLRLSCGARDALALDIGADGQPDDEEARTIDWARRQATILCEYVVASDVLPVKLGAVFSDPEALVRHLHGDAPRLAAIAARLGGQVEYSVALRQFEAPPAPMPEPAAGGRAYLRRGRDLRDMRATRSDHRRRLAAAVGDRLNRPGRHVRAEAPRDRNTPARWSILVPRPEVPEMLSDLGALSEKAEGLGLRVEVVGPWPPFSFLGTGGGAADA
jgi:hypothetical protein